MSAHLGTRVSALLDGQLGEAETDRAWDHVHQCHVCRDLVEREGWVKTRLARWSSDGPGGGGCPASSRARCSACRPATSCSRSPRSAPPPVSPDGVVLSAWPPSAVAPPGMAVMGVLALGTTTAPADVPTNDRRVPGTGQHHRADHQPRPGQAARARRRPLTATRQVEPRLGSARDDGAVTDQTDDTEPTQPLSVGPAAAPAPPPPPPGPRRRAAVPAAVGRLQRARMTQRMPLEPHQQPRHAAGRAPGRRLDPAGGRRRRARRRRARRA